MAILLVTLTKIYNVPLMSTSGVVTPGNYGPPVVPVVRATPTKQILSLSLTAVCDRLTLLSASYLNIEYT